MWEKVKLIDICKPKQWKTISTKQLLSDGYPVYGANGKIGYFDKFTHKSQTLAITCRGATCGSLHITAPYSYITGNAMALDSLRATMNISFLYHYLSLRGFTDVISGSAQPQITRESLSGIEIPIPPLPIQEKIAAILDKADELRRKDQELQDKYDKLAQAIFIDMFGDPVRNEKGWEVKTLQRLGKVDRGVSKHRPRNAPILLGGPYPLVQTGDIAKSGGWVRKHSSSYSEEGLKQSKIWKKGTLCITIAANIARTGILTYDACFPDSIVGFSSNSNSNEIFIKFWFSFFQKAIEDQAPESAQKNINLAILRNLKVIVPPLHLQEAFAKKIELINKLKAKANTERSEELFQSLLQGAFKGELVSKTQLTE